MAATKTQPGVKRVTGVTVKDGEIYSVGDEDISSGDAGPTIDTRGVERVSFQPIITGFTSPTVKAQRSLDGTNWADVASATTATSAAVIDFAPEAPFARVHVTATQSGGADSLTVRWYQRHSA